MWQNLSTQQLVDKHMPMLWLSQWVNLSHYHCPNPGCTSSVLSLMAWLHDTDMDGTLVCGQAWLLPAFAFQSEFIGYVEDCDNLGWQPIIEDQVSQCIFDLQHDFFHCANSHLFLPFSSTQFMQHTLCITHLQWLYRNVKIHDRLKNTRQPWNTPRFNEVGHMMLVNLRGGNIWNSEQHPQVVAGWYTGGYYQCGRKSQWNGLRKWDVRSETVVLPQSSHLSSCISCMGQSRQWSTPGTRMA
jgi:hypothetical protein